MILSADNGGDIHLWDATGKKSSHSCNSHLVYLDVVMVSPGTYFFATADYMGNVTLFGLTVGGIQMLGAIESYVNPGFKNPRENSTGVFADFFLKQFGGKPYIFLITVQGEICVYSYQL